MNEEQAIGGRPRVTNMIVEGPPRSVVHQQQQQQLCRIKRTDVRQKEQKKNDAILQNNPQIDDK